MGKISRESENGDDTGRLDPDTNATWGDSMRLSIVLRGIGLLKGSFEGS
jgi:hypothetical protein